MVNFKTLTVALAALTLVACGSDSNSSDPVIPSGVESGADTDSNIDADLSLDPSGESVMSATVTEVSVGEQAVDESLADELAVLESITRVVETDAGTFDFYAGDTLVMTIGDDGIVEEGGDVTDLSILASIDEIEAEDIRFSSSPGATEQDASTGMFEFDLSYCEAVEQAQNQEQAQDKGEQAQDKEEPVAQNQAQNQTQDKETAQNKETGEDKEVAQDCSTITVSMGVEEVMEEVKQEQAQDKEEPVEQAQDKGEQAQDKGEQAQDKGDQEQAQDKGEQAQDKGDQEQAQDKGDQEQAEDKV